MPRVHHGKVRKDHPTYGIKKGDEAYWWSIKTGPASGYKVYSKTPPKASQLTNSEFQGAMCDFEDEIAALAADDGLEDAVNDIAARIRELGEEQSNKFDNMPDGLQQGDTGQLLEQRSTRCGEIADELEGIDYSDPPEDKGGDEEGNGDKEDGDKDADTDKAEADDGDEQTADEFWQEKLEEVQGVDLTCD